MASKNTVKGGEITDVVISTDTVEALATDYITKQNILDGIEGPAKWAWAKRVNDMLESTADKSERTKKSEELAASIGQALRGKPYSGSWVRLHCMAYKAFPGGLTKESPKEDLRKFQMIISGNASKDAKKSEEKPEPADTTSEKETSDDSKAQADYLGLVRQAIKNALNAGISCSDVQAACDKALKDLSPKK